MPRPYPPEFRQRAVELAREGSVPIARLAKDLGIADSCLRNWLRQAEWVGVGPEDERAGRPSSADLGDALFCESLSAPLRGPRWPV